MSIIEISGYRPTKIRPWHLERLAVIYVRQSSLMRIPSTALTFLVVVIGWVFFRSENAQVAVGLLTQMFSFEGVALSPTYAAVVLDSSIARWIALVAPLSSPTTLLGAVLMATALVVVQREG